MEYTYILIYKLQYWYWAWKHCIEPSLKCVSFFSTNPIILLYFSIVLKMLYGNDDWQFMSGLILFLVLSSFKFYPIIFTVTFYIYIYQFVFFYTDSLKAKLKPRLRVFWVNEQRVNAPVFLYSWVQSGAAPSCSAHTLCCLETRPVVCVAFGFSINYYFFSFFSSPRFTSGEFFFSKQN